MAKHRRLRKCKKCGIEKSLDEFYVRRKRPELRRTTCKECERKRVKKYRRECVDASVFREKNREYRLGRGRFVVALSASRTAAKRGGFMPCTATASELRASFDGKCAICGCDEGSGSLHMDHDHATGKFRGWLCRRCNHAIGLAYEDAELLHSMADYVKERCSG